jgi:predicted RNase H-like nuclease
MFFRRAAGRVLASKKTESGRNERIDILKANGIAMVSVWLEQRHRTGIGRDDLIDACACALVARDGQDSVPVSDADSSQRIPPRIWC